MKKQIQGGRRRGHRRGKLRPNSVDSSPARTAATTSAPARRSSTSSSGRRDDIEVKLILKGGGCENMNAQYSLPAELRAPRPRRPHLEGVRKCILDAVWQAQGKGCAPGALGVCIGGDRTQRLRRRPRSSCSARSTTSIPIRSWPRWKPRSWASANTLDIGRWASAASVSLIGCKVGVQNRLPATFFVSVAYNCWAYPPPRRGARRDDRRDQAVAVSRSSRCRRFR